MNCKRCGGASMMPTSLGILDDIRSVFGKIRYRCTHCHHKSLVRVWPLRDTIHAHCPRCFSVHLQRWNAVFVGSSFHRALIRYLHGHSYRCLDCSHAFVSLRRAKNPLRRGGTNEAGAEATHGVSGEHTYTYEYYYGECVDEQEPKKNSSGQSTREYAG
jgi:transposase-like protein